MTTDPMTPELAKEAWDRYCKDHTFKPEFYQRIADEMNGWKEPPLAELIMSTGLDFWLEYVTL